MLRTLRYTIAVPLVYLLVCGAMLAWYPFATKNKRTCETTIALFSFPSCIASMRVYEFGMYGEFLGPPHGDAPAAYLPFGVLQWTLLGGFIDWLRFKPRPRLPQWVQCRTCGYDLRGSPGPRCPECGTNFTPPPAI